MTNFLKKPDDDEARGQTPGAPDDSRTASQDAGSQDGGQATAASLRDFFAAIAMSKFTVNMSEPDNPAQERLAMATAARMAYGIADAMLAARTKKP